MVRHIGSQLLDGIVHLEQQRPLAVLAHQALGPEKRGVTLATGHRVDLVQAGAGVQHQVTGGQLDLLHAIGVLNHQFAAVIAVRVAEEQRRGQVGTHPLRAALGLAQGVVDVEAEVAAFAVAVDQRREHLVRQGCRHEAWGFPQAVDQRTADFLGQRMTFRQLQVVLGLRRLITRRNLAIGPVGPLQRLADTGQFISVEQAWDVKQHGNGTVRKCKGAMILIPFCATQAPFAT
ncbi:hypothetical protein D9M71_451620 [compost metagenome]